MTKLSDNKIPDYKLDPPEPDEDQIFYCPRCDNVMYVGDEFLRCPQCGHMEYQDYFIDYEEEDF